MGTAHGKYIVKLVCRTKSYLSGPGGVATTNWGYFLLNKTIPKRAPWIH